MIGIIVAVLVGSDETARTAESAIARLHDPPAESFASDLLTGIPEKGPC